MASSAINNKFVVTAAGFGSRMKSVSPLPKYMLHYKGERIIEHLIKMFNPLVISTEPIDCEFNLVIPQTNSRKETLEHIKHLNDVHIIDCDIYIPKFEFTNIENLDNDSLYISRNNKNAGVYFIKSVSRLLEKMEGDDIVSGMDNYYRSVLTTIHLGTPEEYYYNVKSQIK